MNMKVFLIVAIGSFFQCSLMIAETKVENGRWQIINRQEEQK